MREWKRIFLSRGWLAAAALLLIACLGIYVQEQSGGLNCSVSEYSRFNNQWRETLSTVSTEEGLILLEQESKNLMGWMSAKFVVQREEDGRALDDEEKTYYNEKYDGFEEMLQAVRDGTAPDNNIAALAAIERWTERLTYIAGYAESVHSITVQAELVHSNPLFSEPGSFSYRDAVKTEADYLSAAEVELEIQPDDVIRSVVENKTGLVFALFLMAVTVVLIMEPRRLGLENIERSCVNGRMAITGWRLGAIALSALFAALMMRGGQLIVGMLLYRQPLHLGMSLQSISFFQSWAAPYTVGGFLVWYFLFSVAGLLLAGLLFWLMLAEMRSLPLGLVLCAGFLLVEYQWFQKYHINDALYPLAGYNLFHLLSPGDIAGRYINYNLFGYPVRERAVLAIVLAGTILICVAVRLLSVRFAKGQRRDGPLSRILQKIAQYLRGLRRPMPMWVYEGRKMIVYCGGFLFLVASLLFLWSMDAPHSYQTQAEAILTGYVQIYAGPLDEDILTEISAAADKADQAYAEAIASENENTNLEYYAAVCWALDTLEDRYQTLLSMQVDGIEGLELVDEQPIERIYGETGETLRIECACAVLLALCLLLPGAFYLENRYKMNLSLLSTPNGRTVLWRKKILLSVGLAVILWLAWSIREMLLFYGTGGNLNTCQVSAASVFYWNSDLGNIPLGGYLAILYGMRLLGLLAACGLVFWISARLPALLPAAGIGTLALLVPALLTAMGVSVLKYASWALWLAGSDLSVDWMKLVCMGVWVVVCTATLIGSRYEWRRSRA